MSKQITRVAVLQNSKVIALLYTLMSLIYTVIGVFMLVLGSGEIKFLAIFYIIMPVFTLIFGFLMMLLCCWLYNVVAGWVGGIEVTVEEK